MTEIATRNPQQEIVAQIRGDVFREQAAAALPPDVPVERFVRITVTALLQDPTIANLEQRSLFNALLKAASLGLMPDANEAAIVPFKGKAQLIPMIGGFRKIASQYGWTLRARVVCANDEFVYEEGLEPRLVHIPVRPGRDRGEKVAVYAVAQHKDGRRLDPVVLYADEVEKIRQTSKQPDGELWGKWTDRAWEKTAGRRLFKELPLDEKDRERIERVLSAEQLGDPVRAIYGNGATPALAPGTAASQSAATGGAEPEAPDAAGPPTDDEPVLEGVVVDEELEEAGKAKVPGRFTNGTAIQAAGLTLAQVAENAEGRAWLRWGAANASNFPEEFRGPLVTFVRLAEIG